MPSKSLITDKKVLDQYREEIDFYNQYHTSNVDLLSGKEFAPEVYQKILNLDQMSPDFTIEWKKGPSMPTAIQECMIGLVADRFLVYTTGYCGKGSASPEKKRKYTRGFSKKAFAYDMQKNKWITLPNFPEQGRQGARSIVIDNKLYCWGGWTYEPIKESQIAKIPQDQWPAKKGCRCFRDGYCLTYHSDETWTWTKIIPLPFPRMNFGLCCNENKIYVCFGGENYNGQVKSSESYNRLYMLDLDVPQPDWKLLTTFPGTPRINLSMTYVDGNIYVIGGIFPIHEWEYNNKTSSRWMTILDNWKYNLATNQWIPIADNLTMTSNWGNCDQIVWQDRYIILMGGAFFSEFKKNNVVVRRTVKPCLCSQSMYSHCDGCGSTFLKHIFAYDIQNDRIVKCQVSLPGPINLPIMKIYGNQIYALGGETYGFTYDHEKFHRAHIDLFLIGTIKDIN